MKILLATSKATHTGGGVTSYNQELLNLFGREHEFHLLTEANENEIDGYKSVISTYGHLQNDIAYAERLVNTINSLKFDCIINSTSKWLTLITPYLSSYIISVSHFVNGTLALNAGFNSKYVNAIITLSDYGKEYLINTFKIQDSSKVKVIYNFVADKSFDYRSKINRKCLKIVYPGGTSTQKSVDVVQRLLYRLLATKLKFEFVWIGNDKLPASNFSLLQLKTTAQLFEKDKRLKIMGKVTREEAEDIMASTNIFLLPSRGEGCPMTLLEAMRGGCIPIVSDAHHGSREIIEKSKAGIIVKQDSSKRLFKEIKNIIEHSEYYNCYYSVSQDYLKLKLSQQNWKERMSLILQECEGNSKKYINFTKKDYENRRIMFITFQKKERIKEILLSFKCRFNFEISYLLNKLRY